MGTQNNVQENIGAPSDKLRSLLKALREPRKVTRVALYRDILDELKYNKKLPPPKMDAFLIKAIFETFGESTTEADIVLMALGLLDGYDYRTEPKVMERRAEYLRKSEYLSYNNAIERAQKQYRDNLRKAEDPMLLQLADFLHGLKNNVEVFLDDIADYMDDDSRASFPPPNYIKKERLLDEITVVEKYLLPGKSYTIEHKATMTKDNKYEVKISLTEHLPGIASALTCLIFLFSAVHYSQSYQLQKEQQNYNHSVAERTLKYDYGEISFAQQEDLSNMDD